MLGLLRKEWRENRALFFGLLAAAPALSVLVKTLMTGWTGSDAFAFTAYGIPAMLGLYFLGMASDLVAADSAAERHVFVAALPVNPGTVWAAKAVFLFGSAAVYLGWLVLTEAAILAATATDVQQMATLPAWWYALILGVVPVGGAATLFWSTLIDRGLTAAFAALFTLAGVALVVLVFDVKRFHLDNPAPRVLLEAGFILTVGFLAGSLLAFTVGRIHLGHRFRRVVLAVAMLVVIVLPAGAQAAVRLERWARISPGDPDLRTFRLSTEPAGDWEFVSAFRDGSGPLGAAGGALGPHAVFAVHRADGRTRDLTRFGTPLHRDRTGEAPGRIRLLRQDRLPGGSRTIALVTDYDLEAGEPVTTRPWNPVEHGEIER